MAQLTGVILGRPESTSGTGKTGRSWTQHKYTVLTEDGKRSMTTFDNAAFGEIKEGQTYKLTYTEKPNPKSPQYPYLNLEAWVLTEAAATQTKPVTRGDFQRSKEQCTMENMLIATQGDWDLAIALYDQLADWEAQRVGVSTQVKTEVAEVKEPVKAIEAAGKALAEIEATVDADSTLAALKTLSAARFKDGVEVLNVAKLKALCTKTYKGKNLRELNIEELHSLTKMVEIQVEKIAGE